MSDDDDDLMFEDEAAVEPAKPGPSAVRWKMLVVDDEPEVHSITRLVLADFSFKGRSAQFLSAYSAAEAIEILEREKDIAIILLDVVMETDDAGLKLVHHIREV
ncbi:MAG: phosphodiesterase, partial [Rhodospirillaceae bacterium]